MNSDFVSFTRDQVLELLAGIATQLDDKAEDFEEEKRILLSYDPSDPLAAAYQEGLSEGYAEIARTLRHVSLSPDRKPLETPREFAPQEVEDRLDQIIQKKMGEMSKLAKGEETRKRILDLVEKGPQTPAGIVFALERTCHDVRAILLDLMTSKAVHFDVDGKVYPLKG